MVPHEVPLSLDPMSRPEPPSEPLLDQMEDQAQNPKGFHKTSKVSILSLLMKHKISRSISAL